MARLFTCINCNHKELNEDGICGACGCQVSVGELLNYIRKRTKSSSEHNRQYYDLKNDLEGKWINEIENRKKLEEKIIDLIFMLSKEDGQKVMLELLRKGAFV